MKRIGQFFHINTLKLHSYESNSLLCKALRKARVSRAYTQICYTRKVKMKGKKKQRRKKTILTKSDIQMQQPFILHSMLSFTLLVLKLLFSISQ